MSISKSFTININDEIITPNTYNLDIKNSPSKIIINIKKCVFLDIHSFSIVYYIDPLPKEVIINAPKLKYIDNYNPTYMINNIYKLKCKNKLTMPKSTDKDILTNEFKTNKEYFNFKRLYSNKHINKLDIKNVKYVFGYFEPNKIVTVITTKDNVEIFKKYFKSNFKFKNIKFVFE